jgi:hypothetical protein
MKKFVSIERIIVVYLPVVFSNNFRFFKKKENSIASAKISARQRIKEGKCTLHFHCTLYLA